MIRLLLLPLVAMLLTGASPTLVPDVSQRRIDIIYSFTGAELLLFGAILYPGGRLPSERADIAVVLRGPSETITLRQKEKVAGMWMNTRSTQFRTAPAFYAIATSAPLDQIIGERDAAIYELGIRNLQLSPSSGSSADETRIFESGLIDLRSRHGLFVERPGGVEITDGVLYRARLPVPARVPVGRYTAETFLIQDGQVLARATREIDIEKSGFERLMFLFAQKHSLIYGITAVALAMGLGWGAGAMFRRV
jgi:uncharacterized protein (TIGR02186 family)